MAGRSNFETLNGLRGIAALLVFLWHLAPGWPRVPFLGSAYLCVDLFFMMSGFVIAYAYEDKLLGGMGFRRFAELRAIRLYPLYLLGTAIGALGVAALAIHQSELWRLRDLAYRLPWAVTMLPKPSDNPEQWWALNWPAWSLFYELVINLAYAATIRLLSDRVLLIVAALSAGVLLLLASQQGTLNLGGHGWPPLVLGFSRPGYSFPVGVLLFRWWRRGLLPRTRVSPLWSVALFLLPLLLPTVGTASGILAPLTVFLLFPAVVVLAAASEPAGAWLRLAVGLGALSYPLYALHFPLIRAFQYALGEHHPNLAGVLMLIVIPPAAWAAGRWFDEPVRATLSRRAALRRQQVEQAPAL